jgi:hypothetical protein
VQRAESISSKNRRVTVCELANMGQFRTFWNTIWTVSDCSIIHALHLLTVLCLSIDR